MWEETFSSLKCNLPPAPPFLLAEKKMVVFSVKKRCVLWGTEEPHTQTQRGRVHLLCCSDNQTSNILLPLCQLTWIFFFFLNLNQALVRFLLCVYTQQNKVEIEDRSFQSLDYNSIQTIQTQNQVFSILVGNTRENMQESHFLSN